MADGEWRMANGEWRMANGELWGWVLTWVGFDVRVPESIFSITGGNLLKPPSRGRFLPGILR